MKDKLKVKTVAKQPVKALKDNRHFPNDETKTPEEADAALENNQDGQMLEDPNDKEGMGRTHFANEETEKPAVPTKSQAAVVGNIMKRLATQTKASTEEPGAAGPAKSEDETGNGNNLSTLGNGVEAPAPTDGYVEVKEGDKQPEAGTHVSAEAEDEEGKEEPEVAEDEALEKVDAAADEEGDDGEDEEGDEEEEVDEHEVAAAFDFNKQGKKAKANTDEDGISQIPMGQSGIEVGADVDEEWDPEPEDEGEELEIVDEEEPAIEEAEGIELEDDASEFDEDDLVEPTNVEGAGDADVMDLIDVDGTEDTGDDIAFASLASVVHVIKGSRIVASMGKKQAVKAGVEDMYMSDEFHEVVANQVDKDGLRKGLKSMGFVMARVNVTSSKVINKRVEAKAAKVSAAVRADKAQYDAVLEQSLAIAATGMAKQYFKGVQNPLKAAMVQELETMGVRGASRLVAGIFARAGIPFTKELVATAKRISAMPQELRNSTAAALDMISDDAELEDEDDHEVEAEADEGDDFEDGMDEEFIDDIEAPTSLEAALSRPIHRRAQTVSASKAQPSSYDVGALLTPRDKTKLSAAAQAVLSGNLLEIDRS